MQKYILDKTIESNNANSIKDLKGVSKAAWRFILSLYKAHWDSLIMDDTNMWFRNKVKSKFSSQVFKKLTNNKGKNTVKPSYISTLLSSISKLKAVDSKLFSPSFHSLFLFFSNYLPFYF